MTILGNQVIALSVMTFATMGGVYFTFSTFVMRALNELPATEAAAAMNAINRVILTSWFKPLFFGSSLLALLGIGIGVVNYAAPLLQTLSISSGVIYLGGMLAVTGLFNVPLNNRLAEAATNSTNVENNQELWRQYYHRWMYFNHIRTISCLLSSLLVLIVGLQG